MPLKKRVFNKIVTVRVLDNYYSALLNRARLDNRSLSCFVRSLILSKDYEGR